MIVSKWWKNCSLTKIKESWNMIHTINIWIFIVCYYKSLLSIDNRKCINPGSIPTPLKSYPNKPIESTANSVSRPPARSQPPFSFSSKPTTVSEPLSPRTKNLSSKFILYNKSILSIVNSFPQFRVWRSN